MQEKTIRFLTRSALIAALYAALCLLLMPLSFGTMQVRVSEMFTVLPVFLPEAVPGLTLGCLLSNLLGGAGAPDVVLGTLATLVSAIGTRLLRKKAMGIALLPPVLFNAVIVGAMLAVLMNAPLWLTMLSVGAGQLIACYGLGLPLGLLLRRYPSIMGQKR